MHSKIFGPRSAGALLLAFLLSTLLGGSALLVPTAQAAESSTTRTVTLKATKTTYTSSTKPTTSYDTATKLHGSKSMYAAYLGFDKLTLAKGETITATNLNLNVTKVDGTGNTDITVIPVNNTWTAKALTYNNAPAPLGTAINTTKTAPAGKTTALKLDTAKVTSQLTTGSSFQVRNTISSADMLIQATGDNAPTLTITIKTPDSSTSGNANTNSDSNAVAPESSTTRTVTLKATKTTYTSSTKPTTSYDTATKLHGSKSMYAAYLGFDKLTLAKGETITATNLNLNVTKVDGTGNTDITVIPVNNTWTAKALTYNNAPAPLGTAVNTTKTAPAGKTTALKLDTAKVTSQLTTGSSFQVRNTISSADMLIQATGDNAPTLTITIKTPATTGGDNSTTGTDENAGTTPDTDNDSKSSAKMVFAHYFTPYPISIDNLAADSDYYARNYLVASGENGKYANVGGLLRDRPIAREPISGSNWKLEDLKTEVKQAIAGGIDGFAVDILSLSGANWDRTVLLMQAASEVDPDFKIMIQPDATASAGSASTADLAKALATLAKYPSAYKLDDGRVLISPFKAEKKTAAAWQSVRDEMKSKYQVSTAFLPLFLNASNMDAYANMSIGFGNWGARDPKLTANGPDYAAQAHKLGKLWMQPVAVQDARPNQKLFDEAGNTETLRAGWSKAISDDADMVLLTTWNDYSEGTSFAPSENHGTTFLDISSYYAQQFKTGTAPKITTDKIYVTHRVHSYQTMPSYSGVMVQWSGNRTPVRDTVEVLTSLKSAGTVSVTVGNKSYSYDAPAGVSAKTFPLATGYTTATLGRGGATVTSVKTKDQVKSSITQQDMTYHAVSSK